MANDATDSPHGMVLGMASCRTESTGPTVGLTRRKIRAGLAETATEPTSTIQAHNSPLSAGEQQWIARIRQDRAKGFMVSGVDVDFLLVTLRRFGE